MREIIVQLNTEAQDLLSKDLGAFAGFLFEIGIGRIACVNSVENISTKEKAEKIARKRHKTIIEQQKEESEYTQIQHLLIKIGRALKYEVHVRSQ